MEKFPYEKFSYRLEYQDGKDKRICWFECEDHLTKHITRYKLTDVIIEVADGSTINIEQAKPKTKKNKQKLFSSLEQFFTENEKSTHDVAMVGESTRSKSRKPRR